MKDGPLRVCVVGSGTRFLSGISYYTIRLANALAGSHHVSAILMRRLLPARFYPGQNRVGAPLTSQKFSSKIEVYDGVDWFWIPGILGAIALLLRERPDVVIFQWWTGTVLHTYLLLAWIARLINARVIVEFHEVLDTAEARQKLVFAYVSSLVPWLIKAAAGFVIHSEFDRLALQKQYRLGDRPAAIIHHGPYDQYELSVAQAPYRDAPDGCCNLLFFGVIRPFKGLEDLIGAFDSLPPDEIERYWLTIIGETWESWTLPARLVAQSRYKGRISFINRYVNDEEAAAFFAGADIVVLPYHRSSASGPLHIAMSQGLPVITTDVGGLSEAVEDYEGAFLVPPLDCYALREEIRRAFALRGSRFHNPGSWEKIVLQYESLFNAVLR